jgi:hypothetical protein
VNRCEHCGTVNWSPYKQVKGIDVCSACGRGLVHGQCNPHLGHCERVEALDEDGRTITGAVYRRGPTPSGYSD